MEESHICLRPGWLSGIEKGEGISTLLVKRLLIDLLSVEAMTTAQMQQIVPKRSL